MWWWESTLTETVRIILGRRKRRSSRTDAQKKDVKRRRWCRWLVHSAKAASASSTDTRWTTAAEPGAQQPALLSLSRPPVGWPSDSGGKPNDNTPVSGVGAAPEIIPYTVNFADD